MQPARSACFLHRCRCRNFVCRQSMSMCFVSLCFIFNSDLHCE